VARAAVTLPVTCLYPRHACILASLGISWRRAALRHLRSSAFSFMAPSQMLSASVLWVLYSCHFYWRGASTICHAPPFFCCFSLAAAAACCLLCQAFWAAVFAGPLINAASCTLLAWAFGDDAAGGGGLARGAGG